jgi:Domain of unknown function (DUF5615)
VLKGYADHHVVFAIVQALCTRGMDVMTAADRGQQEADDAELLADALANQRVMLTNDTDFLALAAEHARRGEVFAPIFFWPQQRRGHRRDHAKDHSRSNSSFLRRGVLASVLSIGGKQRRMDFGLFLLLASADAAAAVDLPKLLGLRKISEPGPFSPCLLQMRMSCHGIKCGSSWIAFRHSSKESPL